MSDLHRLRTWMALDAGQTAVKARVLSPGQDDVDVTVPGVKTNLPLGPQIVEVVAEVSRLVGVRAPLVAIGSTGLTSAEADAGALLTLLRGHGVTEVCLAHDSVSSYLGALGDQRGAVVAAGTGSIILALGRHHVARVDGWGHIMGDSGSGFWIGREGLRAAMRAYDGRGPETAIVALVRERWPDLEAAYIPLQSDADQVRIVASFSQSVAAVASTDPVAARICAQAGSDLAESVAASLRRVDEPVDDPPGTVVATLGKVFGSDFVHASFVRGLAERVPAASIIPPAGTGLDGVSLMPTLGREHPLRKLISVASA